MTPDTIARLYDLLENNPPRVNIDAKVFRQLLDRAALVGSAAIAGRDLVTQRDAALEELAEAEGWIEALSELLARRMDKIKGRESRHRAADLWFEGAPGA